MIPIVITGAYDYIVDDRAIGHELRCTTLGWHATPLSYACSDSLHRNANTTAGSPGLSAPSAVKALLAHRWGGSFRLVQLPFLCLRWELSSLVPHHERVRPPTLVVREKTIIPQTGSDPSPGVTSGSVKQAKSSIPRQ